MGALPGRGIAKPQRDAKAAAAAQQSAGELDQHLAEGRARALRLAAQLRTATERRIERR